MPDKEPRMAGKKISNGLVALSSAAVFAVYAAGYQRTNAAADRFAAQGERRTPVPIAASFVAPAQALPSAESTLAAQPSPAPSGRSNFPEAASASLEKRPSNEFLPVEAAPPQPLPTASVVPPPALVNEPVTAIDPPAPQAPAVVQEGLYKDGTYTGWG